MFNLSPSLKSGYETCFVIVVILLIKGFDKDAFFALMVLYVNLFHNVKHCILNLSTANSF